MRDRCAIVTGASGGIGSHVALALSERGMAVALAARGEVGLERTGQAISRAGGRWIAVPTDVTDEMQLRRLIEGVERELGGVDVLVNNAGVETFARYDLVERAEIDAALRVNLLAPMLLTQMALPAMLERGRGHVVNVASLAGRFGLACMETYAATKSGLIGFTQSLRATYRGTGVSASVICPGFVAEGGMYDRFREAGDGKSGGRRSGHGRRFRPVPASTVGRAVARAVELDLPEVIVTPRPVRPLLAAATLAPRMAERVVAGLGLHDVMRQVARGGHAEWDATGSESFVDRTWTAGRDHARRT